MMIGREESSDIGEKRLSREYPNVFLNGLPSRASDPDPEGALASRRSAADDDLAAL